MKINQKRGVFALLVSMVIGVCVAGATAHAQAQEPKCEIRNDGSSLCLNDRIMDYRNEVGTIQDIYSNGTGVVKFDKGDINVIDLQYVAREVTCLYGFCAGDRVIDSRSMPGWIDSIFENGKAEIAFDSGELWVETLDQLRTTNGPIVVIHHPWPMPRPYPDVIIYHRWPWPDAPYYYPYPWPYGYPYAYPGRYYRVIPSCHPVPPPRIGTHPVPHYPNTHSVPYPRSGRDQPSPRSPGHGTPGPSHPAPQPPHPTPGHPTPPTHPVPPPHTPPPHTPAPSHPSPSHPAPAPSHPPSGGGHPPSGGHGGHHLNGDDDVQE